MGGFIGNLVGDSGREIPGQFIHLGLEEAHGFHCIGAGSHLDGHSGGRLAVAAGKERVAVGAQLHPRHVPQFDGGTV